MVVKANAYARQNGKTPFVIYQGEWSILERDFERDIIPMARSEGIPIQTTVYWRMLTALTRG